jgi:hypothetical protein
MLTKLRYQVKIDILSDKPREKKYPANSPHFFFSFFFKKKNEKQQAIWK